ncbi:TELO2-interacting protein 2 [Genypterus blacodes]|uniref:TELO2-interacting protein 2 n=1 Tax=Genypterus blacodes TaxID=154954 RepID=UPI003F77506C
MELSSFLDGLHLSSPSSEKPHPSPPCPPITEVLTRLRDKLACAAEKASDSETSALIGCVERLFQTADPHWLFSPSSANQGEDEAAKWAELQAAYVALVSSVIGCASLPLCDDDSGALSASDYAAVPRRVIPVCHALTAALRALTGWEEGGGASKALLFAVAPPTCVFAVTHFQDQLWTSLSSRAAAQSLQAALLRAGHWKDSAHLLMGDVSGEEEEETGKNKGILGGILDVLQPELSKDRWQRCEAVKLVFSWTLLQVSRPSLSPHLPRLLPPSLLLNDHYRLENCMLGVHCLHHIVLNTPPAELCQFNRAEVVYQALFKHLYTSESALIQLVLSCLLDLLLVFESPPSSLLPSSSRRKPCRHDDVLRLVLTHMEAEHKVALRHVYASALPQYIDRMGVSVCRHLRRVERVVLGYLEVRHPPDELTRLKILDALQKTLRATWPRMDGRVSVLLRCLLRLLVDVASDVDLSVPVREQLMSETCRCIKLLDSCTQGQIQPLLQQVDSSCVSPEVQRCLAMVSMATQS